MSKRKPVTRRPGSGPRPTPTQSVEPGVDASKRPDVLEVRELCGPDGVQGALICYPADMGQRILAAQLHRQHQTGRGFSRGSLAPAFLDSLLRSSPLAAAAIQSGQVYEIVGSPAVLDGLKSGALKLMESDGGFLGAAISKSSGQIVGQARFEVGSAFTAPLLLVQTIQVVAGVYALAKINERLDGLYRQVEQVLRRLDAEFVGALYWATEMIDDLLGELEQTGEFSPIARIRLANIEATVGPGLHRGRVLVDDFRQRLNRVKGERGTAGLKAAEELATEEAKNALRDMELLVAYATVDIRLQRLLLQVQLADAPSDVARRMKRLEIRMEEHSTAFQNLPSVKALEQHMRECAAQLGDWRLWSRWQAQKSIDRVDRLDLKDVEPPEYSQPERAPRVLVYRNADGNATAVQLDPVEVPIE